MLTLECDEIVKSNCLRANVALFKVGMNHACRLRPGVADMNRPGADLFYACREIGLQAQQRVRGTDQAVQAWLRLAQLFQEHLAVLVAHLAHFGFQLRADGHDRRFLRGGEILQAVQHRVVLKTVLGHIGHKHGGLGGNQEELLEQRKLFLAELYRSDRFGFVQRGLALFQDRHQLDRFLVARAGQLGHAVQGFFYRAQVGQAEFGLDHFNVGNRVDPTGHMNHVVVFKAAHHIDRGIGLADMGQEFVAQTLACAGAGHEARNVHELDNRRHDPFRRDDGGELLQAGIGHLDDPDVGFDGAERIIFGSDTRLGQRVEQGRFTDIGQAYDAAFHEVSFGWGGCTAQSAQRRCAAAGLAGEPQIVISSTCANGQPRAGLAWG